jgi:Leucine-rich repeat (LRR) protein
MKEFEINKYLKLRLEDGKTNIYVNNIMFTHCKYILLNIPIERITPFDEIASLDEAIERLDKTLERDDSRIPPEVEFWGHCSNLQVWYENNYKTHLLDMNLAFPLLKRLAEVGDVKASQVFKEEIAKRLESGNSKVINFLITEGYTNYLQYEDLVLAILKPEEAVAILELNDIIVKRIKELSEKIGIKEIPDVKLELAQDGNDRDLFTFLVENKSVVGITAPGIDGHHLKFYFEVIPDIIGNLKMLKKIDFRGNKITTLPKTFQKLELLEELDLSNNKFQSFPIEIRNIEPLKKLNLSWNYIENISASLKNLKNLKELNLESNSLIEIPITLCEAYNLKKLNLSNNNIKKITKSIKLLKNLKIFNLYGNKLKNIPEEIGNLKMLEDLKIARNNLNQLPRDLLKLSRLKSITINKNQKSLNLLKILKKKRIVIEVID